jgi:malonate-semialdehyde dehydrogenase (acetylating)/methylmalonate-semialdehyde dehydrogenase
MDAEAMTATAEVSVRLLDNYIGGRWTAPSSSETLPVRSPATGEPLARVPLSSAADLAAAELARSGLEPRSPAVAR